mmetsp:Transcript_54182/g.141662  ORF Transcript_54182/g.141662 Transcript_54182/m.141662 type:complete len:218 (-) Transcript_54182:67-720(-)
MPRIGQKHGCARSKMRRRHGCMTSRMRPRPLCASARQRRRLSCAIGRQRRRPFGESRSRHSRPDCGSVRRVLRTLCEQKPLSAAPSTHRFATPNGALRDLVLFPSTRRSCHSMTAARATRSSGPRPWMTSPRLLRLGSHTSTAWSPPASRGFGLQACSGLACLCGPPLATAVCGAPWRSASSRSGRSSRLPSGKSCTGMRPDTRRSWLLGRPATKRS